MMKNFIRKYAKAAGLAIVAAAGAATTMFSACNSLVYDYEGDCNVTYRLKFRYDLNLKWADAFANEVKSLRCYVFDNSGKLIREYDEQGQQLADPDFAIELDLPAGNYHFMAWCGIDNPGAQPQFDVPQATTGVTIPDDLTCRLNRRATQDYPALSDQRLEFMFHGQLDAVLPEPKQGGDYTYIMPLTKDTNHLRIILQHLSGQDLDVEQFQFKIEDSNGFYDHKNNLLDDEIITYEPYSTSSGEAGVIIGDNSRAVVDVKTAIADFSFGRMAIEHKRDMILTIINRNGKTIARIPVIDYALLAKDYYEEAYGHIMTDQEFLDREDEYIMTFFIDENHDWYSAYIYILSWRIVLHNYDI